MEQAGQVQILVTVVAFTFLIPLTTPVNIGFECSPYHSLPHVYSGIIYGNINVNNARSHVNSENLRVDIYSVGLSMLKYDSIFSPFSYGGNSRAY